MAQSKKETPGESFDPAAILEQKIAEAETRATEAEDRLAVAIGAIERLADQEAEAERLEEAADDAEAELGKREKRLNKNRRAAVATANQPRAIQGIGGTKCQADNEGKSCRLARGHGGSHLFAA